LGTKPQFIASDHISRDEAKAMLFKIYVSLSVMVFVLAISQFWQDAENPKASLNQWLFLALAMLLSPIVLPNMILRRLQKNAGAHSISLRKILNPLAE
jgi:hypothetical protein